jgi:hypothetical protein
VKKNGQISDEALTAPHIQPQLSAVLNDRRHETTHYGIPMTYSVDTASYSDEKIWRY